MVNTNNTKFTFNKKGFALSLACVGLLATAGNAGITPAKQGDVTVAGNSTYEVTVETLSNNLTITGTGNILGFNRGGDITISGGVTFDTGIDTGSLKHLKLFNVSGSHKLILKDALNINVDTTTIDLGGNNALALSGGAIALGNNKFGTINVNNITIDKAHTISNNGTIDALNWKQNITAPTTDALDLTIENTGVITKFTIEKGKGFEAGSTGSGDLTINNTNGGVITTFTNNGTLKGAEKSIVTIDNNNNSTIKTFENKGLMERITINGATAANDTSLIETFDNAGIITNSTIKGKFGTFNNSKTINGSITFDATTKNFSNSGQIKKTIGGDTFNLTASDKFTNTGSIALDSMSTITLGLGANAAATSFGNAGTITGGSIGGHVVSFVNEGKISIHSDSASSAGKGFNVGVYKDFTNKGTMDLGLKANNVANTKLGTITLGDGNNKAESFTNASGATLKDAYISVKGIKDFTNAGSIINASIISDNGSNLEGVIDNFTNYGLIEANKDAQAQRSIDIKATNFTNTESGTIRMDSSTTSGVGGGAAPLFKVGSDNFNNAGKIISSVESSKGIDITASKFDNSGTIMGGSTDNIITIQGGLDSRKTTATFNNSGTIDTEGTILLKDYIASFDNSGTINGGTISGAATGAGGYGVATFTNADTGIITDVHFNKVKATTFTNSGNIKGSTLDSVAITNFTNTTSGKMVISGANTNTIKNFQNDGEFNLTNGSITVSKVFTNTNRIDNAGTINVGNDSIVRLADAVFTNTEKGVIEGGTIAANGWLKSFTNAGEINKITLSANTNATTGILTFTNTGTIANSTLNANVKDFTNTGSIDFGTTATTTIKLLSGNNAGGVSFKNSGNIDNLQSAITVEARQNATFTNTGDITAKPNTNAGLLTLSESAVLDFNNAGNITLDGSGAAIAASATGTKANIINTGVIGLEQGGAHINLDNVEATVANNAPYVVKEWHLSDIRSADGFNTTVTGVGVANTDKIVVNGLTRDWSAKTSNLRFDKGSIVIDPIKNTGIEVGKAYMLDRIVVNSDGAAVEQIHADDGTAGTHYDALITAAYELNKDTNTYTLKAGATDPRLVTIDTIRSSDPIFELSGVDAYAKEGKVGEVIPDTSSGAAVGATTTRKGDGIIDSFQVGVNASKSAGAAVVQSAVNNSITRNAFVSNVVNNAVNAALISLNNFNRVSYNDAEVDFEQLEKYAAVSSDVTDQTYAKDSNVYVMPYYRSTSVDLATNDSLDADTYGLVLGGNKNLGDAGVIGLFLGYENSDGSADKIDTEDDTFFGGINYYKTLGGTSTYDYFVKGMARLAKTSTDVTTKVGGGTSSADTFSYGVEANVGMNFYNGIHTITPEVGLSYDRVSVDGFIQSNGISNDDQDINLVIGKVGINWLAQFTDSLSTNVGVGIRYNFNDDFDANIGIGNQRYSTTTDLGDFYYYLNLGVNVALTQNWELGVMYNGDFSSDANSHSGFVKLGYWW